MNKKLLFRLLILLGLIGNGFSGFAQGIQDSVRVRIEEISIRDSVPIRGFSPGFPSPVMTKFTVVDRDGNFIIGLADTAKWLGPMDVAENGIPMANLWKPLHEYHRDNPGFPTNPDLSQQPFEPRITELREDESTLATTILVMDMSSSMDELVDEVKAGARQYVESLRDIDRTGIILFNRAVSGVLPITSNKDSLYAFIDNAQLGSGTAIYDALIAAVEMIRHENVRPRIIVYTDGADHNSQFTPEAVVDSAVVYRIPIFTIALGKGSYETTLQQIAAGTGGLFFLADNTTQMQALYTRLAALIRNFYVMIHFSSDPAWNNTWRTVDLTLDAPNFYGRGTGEYFVSGLTDEIRSDVALDLAAFSEMVTFENGDSLHWVSAGQSFHYVIRLTNQGAHPANYLKLVQTLPDYVNIRAFSTQPVNPDERTLTWHFFNLAAGDEIAIHLTAELAADVPREVLLQESQVSMTVDTDDQLTNNSDSATVFIFRPAPPKNFDLAIHQSVTTDTTVFQNGLAQPAVWSSAIFTQTLRVTNQGPATAYAILLRGNLVPELSLRDWEASGGFIRNDSLFWEIDSLPANDSLEIKFNLQVAEWIPYHFYPLTGNYQITAENDDSPDNNLAQSVVLGLKHKLHDVSVHQSASADSMAVVDDDTLKFLRPGGICVYTLLVSNTSPDTAQNVVLQDEFPDSVTLSEIHPEAELISPKILQWSLGAMPPFSQRSLQFTATVSPYLPSGTTALVNRATVSADDEPADKTGNNSSVSTRYSVVATPRIAELSLAQRVVTDTSVVQNGASHPAVWSGEVFGQIVVIKNAGPEAATNILIKGSLASELTPVTLEISGGVVRNDSMFWEIDSLPANDSLEIKFNLQVTEWIPYHFYPLTGNYEMSAKNDVSTDNNRAQSRVLGLKHKLHDVSVQQFASADSMAVIDGDTLQFVHPGGSYFYALVVSNISPDTARNVILRDEFPDSVTISGIQPEADWISGKIIQWSLGTMLPFSQRNLRFAATVTSNLPVGTTALVNRASVSADDEAADKTGNNSTVSTRYSEVAAPRVFELSLSQRVVTDTSVVLNGISESAVWSGDSFEQILVLKNAGPEAATNILLKGLLAAELSPGNLIVSGGFRSNDSLVWEIDALPAGDSLAISLQIKTASVFPFHFFPLVSSFAVTARNDISAENNTVQSRVIGLKRPVPLVSDVAVVSFVSTDSLNIVAGDSIWLVDPGEKYHYTLVVSNVSSDTARNVVLKNNLPQSLTVSEINPEAIRSTSDSLRWSLGDLAPFARQTIRFAATLAPEMPVGYNLIVHHASVSAENEAPDKLANNAISDTTYNVVRPLDAFAPQIQARPPVVAVGDPVSVQVQVQVPVRSWDIWIYFANGEIDSTYANDYIQTTQLPVGEWVPIPLPYQNTRLVTPAEQENLIFEIRVLDCCGLVTTARTTVTIGSGNDFNLDRNVFAAATEPDLDINFKLSSNRIASLELFDIAGTRITRIAEQPFNAGWNTYTWNGMTENGQKVGSGLYLVILRSDGYNSWKKLIVVQ